MDSAIILATAALTALTLLPLSRSQVGWVRACEFPRLQIALLLAALLPIQLATLDFSRPWSLFTVAAAGGSLAYQLRWILPYSRLRRPTVAQARAEHGPHLKILTANVLGPNRRSEEFMSFVRETRPDIVVTLESNAWWDGQLQALKAEYPGVVAVPLENLYGIHVFSRLPLQNAEVRYLIEPDVPSVHAEIVLQNGRCVELHFLHPRPPRPAKQGSGPRDAELDLVAKSLQPGRAAVVAGDLNDVAWSRTTRRFLAVSGLLDPRIGRGMYNSFHADHWFARWPLDHLFHSRHFRLASLKRLGPYGSDHFAVLVDLAWAEGSDPPDQRPEGANALRPKHRTRFRSQRAPPQQLSVNVR